MKKRYVSTEAVKRAVEEAFDAGLVSTMDDVLEIIDDVPSADDVVKIVRCGDCRYHEFSEWGTSWSRCSHPAGGLTEILNLDDYCCYAERKV